MLAGEAGSLDLCPSFTDHILQQEGAAWALFLSHDRLLDLAGRSLGADKADYSHLTPYGPGRREGISKNIHIFQLP